MLLYPSVCFGVADEPFCRYQFASKGIVVLVVCAQFNGDLCIDVVRKVVNSVIIWLFRDVLVQDIREMEKILLKEYEYETSN